MRHCSSCNSEVPPGSRYCPSCATPVETEPSADTETTLDEAPSAGGGSRSHFSRSATVSSLDSQDGARFIPGTVLAGRYRIVGLLGRGGMGEVYRADDLKLGQAVAIKFLPMSLERDAGRLERFLNEARTALKVTHPNVCRVYDVGEVDGSHYLSMEYVDGEDLASLLRRIGRLPGDKASQIARQLCAGLASAHEQGILHRDLKPANVMIDGRGRVRITDFGLAGLAKKFEGAEVRAGTPAYMSPEQLSGKGVSTRSDIYALGLVLYELFTGKQTFRAGTHAELVRLHLESEPMSPSSHVERLDDAVERVILRCLEKDPAMRPASALAVAAALPGGDPLAAALAAGETPSPEMVAAAGPRGGLHAAKAAVFLALAVVGLVAAVILSSRVSVEGHLPMDKPFVVLRENAREITEKLGYEDSFSSDASSFSMNVGDFFWLAREYPPAQGWQKLREPDQTAVTLFHRQSPGALVPVGLNGAVSSVDPPPAPGDVSMQVDLQGVLLSLRVTPERLEPAGDPSGAMDWSVLFQVAGLDPGSLEEAEPTILPTVFADERKAWTGMQGDRPLRVEAAAYRGKPVYFRKLFPSDPLYAGSSQVPDPGLQPFGIAFVVILVGLLVLIGGGALFLAVYNLRIGRGDRKGAMRIAVLIFVLRLLHWVITGHHVAGPQEIYLIMVALSGAVGLAMLAWILYVALEPFVRRLWPQAIVSWSRLLAGRFRDPLVGRDVLYGMLFAVGMAVVGAVVQWIGIQRDWLPPIPVINNLAAMRGGRFALGTLVFIPLMSLPISLGFMMLLMLLRVILRLPWLAAGAFCLLYTLYLSLAFATITGGQGGGGPLLLGAITGVLISVLLVVLLIRFGLLATFAYIVFQILLTHLPVTSDTSAPYFTTGLLGPLVALALMGWAAHVARAGRPLVAEGMFEGK